MNLLNESCGGEQSGRVAGACVQLLPAPAFAYEPTSVCCLQLTRTTTTTGESRFYLIAQYVAALIFLFLCVPTCNSYSLAHTTSCHLTQNCHHLHSAGIYSFSFSVSSLLLGVIVYEYVGWKILEAWASIQTRDAPVRWELRAGPAAVPPLFVFARIGYRLVTAHSCVAPSNIQPPTCIISCSSPISITWFSGPVGLLLSLLQSLPIRYCKWTPIVRVLEKWIY